ncbi:chemotaxis protein CheW [Oleiagrimonas sp. C23AA]|uniref:chemotaxis protein CheW n=1 Tax=Oleiagrimonas sp. C23AA TaxID=2719047 RepID=UPI00142286D5|nr:chemotaxis protein CheW [Oleiagrimonas sp. C23AA]NII12392.1 chemotaxis protein CheW [Oleiagrimonas sp. C23AA]
MSDSLPREIRGVLIPITGGRLLLPNASVAEVITLSTPDPVAEAPEWLLGRLAWRGWRLPLVSFATMAGLAPQENALNSRVAVIKALGGNPRMPYIALVTQGFPRLTTLSADIIVPSRDSESLPPVVREQVMVRDDSAVIPDLEALEREVAEALDMAAKASA